MTEVGPTRQTITSSVPRPTRAATAVAPVTPAAAPTPRLRARARAARWCSPPIPNPTCCVVVDGTNVYWVHFAGSAWSIMRVPGAGGTPENFERSEFNVADMAIKDGALYWTAERRCVPARSRRRAGQRDKDR